MHLAVVIPSCNAGNLAACLEAVRRNEPDMPVLVVGDHLNWSYDCDSGVEVVEGDQPFIYARNINIGIRAARRHWRDSEGFLLLNDDALLLTPGGFTRMADVAEEHPDFGVLSAVTNVVGNPAQLAGNTGLREEPNMLCFVCALITQRALDAVGMLDERFTAYGWEDNDFCRRCRLEGIRMGIYDFCFVDHASLHSTFRGDPRAGGDISAGAEIYRAKWGNLA